MIDMYTNMSSMSSERTSFNLRMALARPFLPDSSLGPWTDENLGYSPDISETLK